MYTKVVISGDIVEQYDYEKEPTRRQNKGGRRRNSVRRGFRRVGNLIQLRKSFIRLVWSNTKGKERPVLLTLTMLQVMDVKQAYKELSDFFSRLRRRYGQAFRYIAVPEFQLRGAVHFHCLVWGLPNELVNEERTSRTLQRQWLRGFCDIVFTDGSSKLGGYLAKYMSKTMQDVRLSGQKAYTASRNTLRSVSLKGVVQTSYVDDIVPVDKSLLFKSTYDTLWLGRTDYKRYKIK